MTAPHIRFETRASKPPVFHMTAPLIAAAKARSGLDVRLSLGADLRDTGWLAIHFCADSMYRYSTGVM